MPNADGQLCTDFDTGEPMHGASRKFATLILSVPSALLSILVTAATLNPVLLNPYGLMSCFHLWPQSPEGLEPASFPQQPFSLQRRVSVPCELLVSCRLQLSDAADADKQLFSFQEHFEMVPVNSLANGPVTVSKTQAFVTQVSVL